jgi:UDP-glucose 4-epimerase
MKYLVTGGAGFIGSHLVELLIKKNHTIVCIDDLSSGYETNLFSVIEKIDFYKEKIELFELNKLKDIDAVIHLAAQVSVPLSISDFFKSSSSNLLGTIKVIDYCRLNNIPLIYASSSAIYGNLPFGNDEINNFDLLSPYATDKCTMELFSKTAHKTYKLSSIGLRFFNVYGPRQDPQNPYSGVISIFADRLLKNRNITINGGNQTRDFIYVKDVTNIIYNAISLVSKKHICEISNVLTGKSVKIDKLAKAMINIINAKVDVIYKKLPPGDPRQSNGSYKKMVKLFKVNPENFIELNKGLIKTIEYQRTHNK